MDTPNRKENIAKLLGFLKQKGYASKGLSLEGLDTRLQNDSLRRNLYNALSRDKVPDIGSWDEFSSMVKKEKDSTAIAQPSTRAGSTPLVPNSPLLPSPNKANKNTLSTDWTKPTPQFSIPTSEQNPGVPTLVPSREHPYVGRELAFVSPAEVTNLNTGKKHYDASKTSVIYPDEIGEDNTRKAIDNYTQAKASEANRLDRKIEAQLQDIEKQQKELEARLNKRAKELEAEREGEGWFVNFIRSQPARGMDPMSTINRLTNDGKDQDEEYIGLSSALHNLRKQKEKLLATKKSMQEDASFGSSLKNAGRGFVDTVTDTRIWDGGEGDLREAGLAIKAIGKLELQKKFNSGQATKEDAELLRTLYKGQLKLTPAEDALLNSKAGRAYVDAITKEAIGYGYGAGETTANMLPFIRDIALSPANGLGRSVATNVAKSALKSGLSRVATKAISRTARVVSDIALEGAGTALTTGIGGTLKGAADEQIGDIKYDVDGKTGQIIYGGREHNEENLLKAFGKSLVRQALEYGTEATGGAYIGTLMKPINKYGGKLLTKTLGDKAVSAVEKFFARMEKTSVGKAVNSVGEQVHYDGLPGEYLEEVYNNLLNAVTIGDMKLDTNSNNGVFNPEINKTIIIGLMGAPMATVSLKVGSIVAQDTKTQAMGLRAFGYKQWQEMKTLIGNSDDVSKTISEWAEQNPNATSNQKKAVMRYAVATAMEDAMTVRQALEQKERKKDSATTLTPSQTAEQSGEESAVAPNPPSSTASESADNTFNPNSDNSKRYEQGNGVILKREDGTSVRAQIVSEENEDGKIEVASSEGAIQGRDRVVYLTREELDQIYQGSFDIDTPDASSNEETQLSDTSIDSTPDSPTPNPDSPIGRPITEEEAVSDTPHSEENSEEHEWDELSKQVGEESAREIINSDISDLEAERKKLQKEISKPKGQTREEKIQYVIGRRERLQGIDAEIEGLQRVLQVPQMRIAQAEAQEREQNRIKAEEARRQEEADEQARAEKKRQEAERLEEERLRQEKLQGVPDWVDDTPQNARARGYRRSNGESYDRQERISNGVSGNEVQVKFSNEDMPTGRIMVIEADELQPSHIQGQRNPNFFIDEAQPKDRIDDASVLSARRIAGNMRPEEITGNATAYTGAPIVNSRGEVIQGNNRSDALRYMYQHEQEQAQKYKQYLLDNAERLGLSKDAIMQMNKPVLVTTLEVSDNDAIRLGQMSASDTESGGVERIKPMQTITKMGDNIQSFSRILLSGDEDMDLSSVVDHNGADALKWMHSKGYITDTQYQSAFKAKGELTGEAKNDLINILSEVLFNGAGQQLRDDFEKLPAKAKKAILATIYRDLNSPESERIIMEVQDSIRAYAILQSNSKDFSKAKNTETALRAIDDWLSQQVFDDVSGEIYIPNDRLHFSNFALHLAGVYRGATQSYTSSVFNALYDDIQGLTSDMFDEESGKKHTLTEAIKRQLNIYYNGKTTSSDVAHASQNGSQRERGGSSDYKERNGTEGTSEPSRTGGRSQTDSREVGDTKEERLNKLRESNPIIISNNDWEGKYTLDRASAKQWMKENLRGKYVNKDTGEAINITKVGINEVTSHGTTDIAHLKSLSVIPKLIENSIFIDEIHNTKSNGKYDSYRYYALGLIIDGKDYTAKIVIGVKGDSKYYDHRLTQIEKGALIDTLNGLSNSVDENQAPIPSIHDTKLKEILQDKGSKKNTDLTRSEKEAVIAQAEQELEGLQSEASSLRKEAYQAMRDYYESGAVPDMTEEQFNGEARYMFVGKENRNELALIHAPGLQDILPQLDELANKIRWYKLLVRNSKKALDAEQNTEGKVGNEEDRQRAFNEAIQPETIRFRRGQELQEVNERFNEQLQAQIDGTLPKGHVYSLGMPSDILQSAGIPNLPIELSAERLEKKASVAYSSLHPFNLPDITDLPQSLANPIAVFNSRTKQGAKVILTELKDKRGNNFVVALQVRKSEHSRKMDVEVNDVRSLYPKDRVGGIIGWINQGLLTWVDKKKATEFLSTQEPNYLGGGNQFNSLSDATKVIKEFENPNIEENAFDDDILFRGRYVEFQSGYTERADGTPISNNAKYAEEAGKFPASLFKKKYGISPADFKMLNDLGLIEISEWHHTGATFRETDYYSWVDNATFDDGYNSRQGYDINGEYEYNEQGEATYVGEDENPSMPLSEWYKQNKKAIKPIADAYKAGEWTWEREDPSVGFHRIKNREDAERRMIETYFRKEERQYRNIHWGEYPQSLKNLFSTMLKWDENAHYEDIEAKAERLANEFYDAHIEETLEADRKNIEEGEAQNRAIREKNLSSASKETALMALAKLYGMDEQEAYSKISSSSWDNRNSIRRRSTSSDEASERNQLLAEMEREATRLAHSMGEEVVVVHNEEELVDILGEDGARQARGAKGFYLPKSGNVVIILSNNTDVADVLETIFHEFVGHKGLQEYVGKEEFTAFIDRVHKGLPSKALSEVHREARTIYNERKGTSRAVSYQEAVQEATEEYIARLSERGFSDREGRSTWQKIVDAFRDMISRAKLTLGWNIQDRDIRYILWKSFQMKQKQVAILAEAGDIAMRHRLGLPQKVKVTEGVRERRGATSNDAEMRSIKAQAKKDGTFMKAPNGKPTKLTEKQWLQVRTQSFKNWFGDWINDPDNASKVLDENGEPMIVYHGSKNKFYSFDMGLQKTAWIGKGFYFTPNKEFARSFGRSVVSSFLNLRNPFIVKGNSPSYYDSEVGKIYGKDGGPIEPSEGTALLQDKGHDGVLFTHWDQGQMITVFTPSQIKSATENKGTFDKSNDDIRYRKIDNEMRSVPSELDNKLAITTLSPSTEIPVVQTEKRSVSTAEAKQAIESLPKQVVTMDGYTLNVSKKTKRKLSNNIFEDGLASEYKQILTILPQIVGNSVLIEEHRDRIKINGERNSDNPNDANIDKTQRFYGAITIGEVTYRVKTTAIVSANTEQGTRMHNYDITEIELLPSSPTANSQELAHRSNSISLAKLLNGVGFSYEPERKILDEMQGGTEGIRFRQGNNSQPSWNESVAKTEYNRTTRITDENGNKSKSANLLWRLREAYQDSMLSLKALQDALAKNALGRDLRDFEDAYTAENAMGSKNLSEMEHYDARYVKPLTDAISELMKEGASYEDILNYLRAKHGLERNEYYNAQDRAVAKDKWDSKEALKQQKNPNYQPKDFEYKGEFKDYSGLTGLTGSSEDFTKLSQDMVEEFENKFNTDALWTSVRNANQKTLELGRQKNLIGKHTYEHIKGMFEYYVPLRGWDSNRAEDEWEYLDGAGTMSGNSIRKSAKGRTSVSDDPIAMMIKLAEDTIRQGNRNMMKLKFLNLAENADDKLLQYSRAWFQKKIDQEGNEYWELVTPDIDYDASPKEVSEALLEFNQNMNELRELGEATQYPPKDSRKNITFDKNGSLGERKQHTVTVYRGGQLYTIFVNGNPRAAQAINGSINAGQYSGQIEKIVGPFNRWISAMHTSYNPEFIITNAVRDFQHATFMIFAQEGLGSKYMKDFQKQYIQGLKRSLGLYKRWRSGTLDLSRNEDKMFHDFMINGGQTGYTQISKVEDLKKKVEWELKKAKGEAGHMKVGFEILQEGLELFNGAIELNTRFATFVASRKSGRSIERSISDAKNITVNFNKKGAGGYGAAFFQALYIFFNPAVQALEQSVRVSRKHPKRIAAMIGTMATLAYLQPILFELIGAAAGGDDDDEDAYDNINQNSRLSSLIIRNPLDTSTYINLPISPELKPFFTLGSALAEVQRGAMTTSEATGQILQGMTSLLPLDPAGGNGDKKWINIVPSVVQPLEQVAVNTNYYGESIYKDNGFNKLDPEWTKAKDANPIFTKTSEMLNEWSGGNKVRKGEIDINPEKVEHILEGFTGGAGRATNALFKTFMMPFDSDMRKLNNTVMLRKFYKAIPQAKDGVLSRKIYELQERRKELLEHDKLGYKKQLRESKDTVDRAYWMDEMMELVKSPEYKFFKKNKVKLDILFKLRDKYQKVTNDESRKTISKSMNKIQKEVLKDSRNEL